MNTTSTDPESRLARLDKLLQLDPGNLMLLADAAQAALAEGAFEAADRYLGTARQRDPGNPVWTFRLAGLRIAQRQLGEARQLLSELQAAGVAPPSVAHDLAYVEFLEGQLEQAGRILSPWVGAEQAALPEAAALQSLWLRVLHQADRLEEAWEWIAARMREGGLAPAAAGVASLIAVDRSDTASAEQLCATALRSDPTHVEALIAHGCVLMARGAVADARQALAAAARKAPHQARAWSTLGFVEMLGLQPVEARQHFERALERVPDDAVTLHALGWACLLLNDLPAAARAFEGAVAQDPQWGEGHGGLACTLALQGQAQRAQEHLARARSLQRGSVSARYAHALLTGEAKGLAHAQRLAQQVMAGLAVGRRAPPGG